MSAAFDTLNHRTLINRLVIIGFRDDALNWLKSYITARSWYVTIGKMKSKNVHLDYGVPQGSVLGPILFNIYIAPIFEIMILSLKLVSTLMLMTCRYIFLLQILMTYIRAHDFVNV